MLRKMTLLGMLGSLTYVIHVVLGGFLWKGYNHLMQPISDLTATGAPDKVLLTHITDLYAVFSIIFALCAFIYVRKSSFKAIKAGFVIFFCMHIVSFLYRFFPEDLAGMNMTFTGFMHIVVTSAIAPLSVLSPIVIGIGFTKAKGLNAYSVYSIITGILMFVAGGISVYLMVNRLPYFGLVERINIGSLQLWMFITSLKLFTNGIDIMQTDMTGKLIDDDF